MKIWMMAALMAWSLTSFGFETTVKSVEGNAVTLAGLEQVADKDLFEIRRGQAFCGFARASQAGSAATVEMLAGTAAEGDLAVRIDRPSGRIAFLGGEEGQLVRTELGVLCPGRVTDVPDASALDGSGFEFAVITAPAIRRDDIDRFMNNGGTVIMDLAPYTAWTAGEKSVGSVTAEKPVAEVANLSEAGATAGMRAGQTFYWYGTTPSGYACRYLQQAPKDGRVLLTINTDAEQHPMAVELRNGHLLALDLLSPAQSPGYDEGSVLKWILPGNRLSKSVRRIRELSSRLETWDQYLRYEEAFYTTVDTFWTRRVAGIDSGGRPIHLWKTGSEGKPVILFTGGMHSGEWLSPYYLLDLVRYFADLPEEDYKSKWLLENFSIAIIPMVSGSMKQESTGGCDLNRNFDFNWNEYVVGRDGGWRAGREEILRGSAPFSEPESRLVRDFIWTNPVIAYFDCHMHGLKHGPLFYITGPCRSRVVDAAVEVSRTYLYDRFAWDGPSQATMGAYKPGGAGFPMGVSWAAEQGLWATAVEVCGKNDHSLQMKEMAIESLLSLAYCTAADYSAGSRNWLGKSGPLNERTQSPAHARQDAGN